MPRTILLVDDSATIRNIVKIYLMGLKAEFLEAEGGERALQLARLMPVDLAIVDIKMPGMDGIAFTRAVRSDPREQVRKLPIILLTGESDARLREEGMAAGADDFILKPVDSRVLNEAVGRLMPPGK